MGKGGRGASWANAERHLDLSYWTEVSELSRLLECSTNDKAFGEPRTGTGSRIIKWEKQIFLFAVMRNGFALCYCLELSAMAAGTREGSNKQQHWSLCEGLTCLSKPCPGTVLGEALFSPAPQLLLVLSFFHTIFYFVCFVFNFWPHCTGRRSVLLPRLCKPVFPALGARSLTTRPPGKSPPAPSVPPQRESSPASQLKASGTVKGSSAWPASFL